MVGVILLISSRVQTESGSATRCNVSSWYVEPAFRAYASLLVAKALAHKDVTYLNVTAAPHTRPMLKAQGYAQYSKGVFVCAPALRFSLRDTPARVFSVRPPDSAAVDPHEQHLLEEHAEYGCFSLWCVTPERAYPFVFRPRMAKGVVPCAQLIYCADIEDFARFAGPIGRWLARASAGLDDDAPWRGSETEAPGLSMTATGVHIVDAFVIVDSNGPIRGLIGKYFDGVMPKYFKGPSRPRLGDLAYTETAIFGV